MSTGRGWRGELARPIRVRVIRPHGFVVPDPTNDPDAVSKIRAENELMTRLRDDARAQAESAKLKLLAEHYEVSQNDFRALALAIARDFIPGFRFTDPLTTAKVQALPHNKQEERDLDRLNRLLAEAAQNKTGRPTKWHPDRLEELLAEVDAIKKETGVTDREALSRAAQKKKWGPPANHRGDRSAWIETLESRLQDAKRQRKMYLNALKLLEECRPRNSGKS
jgi:DNA mismatch repair ATPase MutL